ncbi:ROK family protein [Weissella kandleri]|uniref:ROK family protein n=1 Tax=Weissella kandleri TaxID=1616 RepID=UPI00387E9838
MVSKIDQDSMRETNRKLVLQVLFNAEQTSRVEIADQVHLHKSTISSIYRNLEEEGFIEELGDGVASNAGGRRPKLIRFNHNYGYIVTFDLSRGHLRYLVANITGEVIQNGEFQIRNLPILNIQQLAIDFIQGLNDLGTDHGLIGIGLGIHGVVFKNKIRYVPYHEDLLTLNIVENLENQFQVPVYLENEANLAAIYTRDFQGHLLTPNIRTFSTLNIHDGIGSGMIQNDRLFIGKHGEAGEVGRSITFQTNFNQNHSPVHLEDLFSEESILQRTAKALKTEQLSRQEFCSLVDQKNPIATDMLHYWLQALAMICYNMAQQTAPDAILLYSRIIALRPEYFTSLQNFYQAITPNSDTKILFAHQTVDKAILLGGVALVTRKLLNFDNFKLSFH